MPNLATSGEQPVAEVDDFLVFDPEVLHGLNRRLPDPEKAVVAAMHPEKIGRYEATDAVVEAHLELRVIPEKEHVEIPSIRGFTSLAHDA